MKPNKDSIGKKIVPGKFVLLQKEKHKPVWNGKYFADKCCGNIAFFGLTGSGKSVAISNMLSWTLPLTKEEEKLVDLPKKLIIFSNTVEHDPNYRKVLDLYRSKSISVEIHSTDNMIEYESMIGKLRESLRNDLTKQNLRQNSSSTSSDKPDYTKFEENNMFDPSLPMEFIRMEGDTEKKTRKKYLKEKPYENPKYLVVFDDMPQLVLRNVLYDWLKESRHYHCRTFLSSQYVLDIQPSARDQLCQIFIASGFPEEHLERILQNWVNPNLDAHEKYRVYVWATTRGPNCFFQIATKRNEKGIPTSYIYSNFDPIKIEKKAPVGSSSTDMLGGLFGRARQNMRKNARIFL
jgi:hypothetical protein